MKLLNFMSGNAAMVVLMLSALIGSAQEVPLGSWRLHNSYNYIHSITFSSNKVYAASANGIVVFDKGDNSLSGITKMDGLSGTGITFTAFDQPRTQLLISYEDGTLDIVRPNEIIQFTALRNSTTITGSKRINHITLRDGLAYLSADFGVVVFDLALLQVKETWRDLGPSGQALGIRESTFLQDSIFLATSNGVIAGNLSDNLLDFANWKRFDQGNFANPVQSIVTFNGEVHAGISGQGWFAYVTGGWTLKGFTGEEFSHMGAGANMFIVTQTGVWKYTAGGSLTELQNEKIEQPLYAVDESSGKLWIADGRNGLVSDWSGTFQPYLPNGPSFSAGFRLSYNNNSVYANSGGFTAGFEPLGRTEFVNDFSQGTWRANTEWINADVTDVSFSGSQTFIATFGSGLQVIENGSSVLYTNSNSPVSTNRITALAPSADGMWVTNYGAAQSLHLLSGTNWQSFSFPVPASQFPVNLVVDKFGQVWMALNPSLGGGILVFSREKNQHVYLTDVSGSGALPSRAVFSLSVDRDGFVWAGTNAGVAYFSNPSNIFSGNVNSVKPIYDGRFLLRDETVTAIAVDGGNRKWLGTQRGVWLFNPFGEEQLHNFSTQNSPLMSDRVFDIEVHPGTGEVFFMTDRGITSFRSDATTSDEGFGAVKIFPNPVTADFSGWVSITGLATDALVKVTDISGKLIWQTFANGGTATWNVRDYNGRRAATGMYLVIVVSRDASESIVGKIAVIN